MGEVAVCVAEPVRFRFALGVKSGIYNFCFSVFNPKTGHKLQKCCSHKSQNLANFLNGETLTNFCKRLIFLSFLITFFREPESKLPSDFGSGSTKKRRPWLRNKDEMCTIIIYVPVPLLFGFYLFIRFSVGRN